MDFSLTEEQRGYQALVREFAEREVLPHVRDYDREERYPIEIVRKMAPLGFLGGTIPEAYGGPGIDHLTMALGIEEMSRVCIHMGSAMGRAAGLVGSGILQFGTEAQKQRYLVPLARGETFAGTAVTEPHSGTDVAAMETTAVRRGDEYVLNGAKIWISGIGLAEWYLTFATLDRAKGPRGVCAFVVERGLPGLQRAADSQQARVPARPGGRARLRGLPGAGGEPDRPGRGGAPGRPLRRGERAALRGLPRGGARPGVSRRLGEVRAPARRLRASPSRATSSCRRRSPTWCSGSSRPGT